MTDVVVLLKVDQQLENNAEKLLKIIIDPNGNINIPPEFENLYPLIDGIMTSNRELFESMLSDLKTIKFTQKELNIEDIKNATLAYLKTFENKNITIPQDTNNLLKTLASKLLLKQGGGRRTKKYRKNKGKTIKNMRKRKIKGGATPIEIIGIIMFYVFFIIFWIVTMSMALYNAEQRVGKEFYGVKPRYTIRGFIPHLEQSLIYLSVPIYNGYLLDLLVRYGLLPREDDERQLTLEERRHLDPIPDLWVERADKKAREQQKEKEQLQLQQQKEKEQLQLQQQKEKEQLQLQQQQLATTPKVKQLGKFFPRLLPKSKHGGQKR